MSRATAAAGCLYCGDPTVQWHHPTGVEWDPAIVVPVCHDHHRLTEDDWYPQGVGAKVDPQTLLHQVRMGLTRWAMLIGRLADQGLCPDLLTPVARWLATTATRVGRVIDALDAGVGSSWQGLPGIALPLPSARGGDAGE